MDFSRLVDVVFNHMAGTDSGVGNAGSSTSPSRKKVAIWILTIAVQVSRTTITLEYTSTKTSTTAVLQEMTFKTGGIVGKSRTASSPTSPSESCLF